MEENYFNRALSDFTFDVASGGAICHLCDLGYSVKEISEKLLFPTPVTRIRETVWKHLLKKGVILTEDPGKEHQAEKITYVREYGVAGKASFRRVVEKAVLPAGDYIPCDFGKQMYQDRQMFERKLERLSPGDREYLLDLPWPLQTVYHIADERMCRIARQWNEEKDN